MDEVMGERTVWWHSPRLIAAAACFLLGAALLASGLVSRLAPSAPVEQLIAEADLSEFEAGAESPGEPAAEEPVPDLVVYVTGAVVAPEVYRLPSGARVKDAVLAAGGLRADAAAEQLNLAEPVGDAQHVHVPSVDDAPVEGGPAETAAVSDGRIDLNGASAAELEELPGVGKVLAGRIVARREEQGPFTSVDELREVAGVGAKLFEQVAPLVRVGR